MTSQVTCISCKHSIVAAEFLNACTSWFADVDCVQFRCPHCSRIGEARLETTRVTHGYVYAAGSAYFSGQLPESVPDLVVEHTADGLKVTLDEASRTLPRS